MRPRLQRLQLTLLAGLFLLATGGAWAWYHVAPRQFPVSYRFQAGEQVKGWRFRAEPVAPTAVETLATTNLFNGTFTSDRGERVTAFMGTWDADNKEQMSVVGHTPDVCWVGAGWRPIALDHPDKLPLRLGSEVIPFEARTFQAPGSGHLELTVWCTLVSGQVFEETGRFVPPADAGDAPRKALQAEGARHTLKSKLFKVVSDRIPGSGSKQFVRFSTAIQGDWKPAFERLQQFGEQWLQVQVERTAP